MSKKYTLEEAHAKIMEIKKQMGYPEYQAKEFRTAFENGYAKAINDMREDFSKRASLFEALNGSNKF